MKQKFTHLLLADDHTLLRQALKYMVTTLVKNSVVDEACNAESVLTKVKTKKYELIMLDTKMSGIASYQLVTDILIIQPQAPILMLAMNISDFQAEKYLQLGAKGYITKTAPSGEIKNTIKQILDNG